jgi:uncharacterized cupredoxin-like copper-binding protein
VDVDRGEGNSHAAGYGRRCLCTAGGTFGRAIQGDSHQAVVLNGRRRVSVEKATSEITVKAGQPVSLRLVNRDGYAHAFYIDEFNIHTWLAANETAELSFTPEKPGRYPFYCSSPGHEMAGMVGTLIVEP